MRVPSLGGREKKRKQPAGGRAGCPRHEILEELEGHRLCGRPAAELAARMAARMAVRLAVQLAVQLTVQLAVQLAVQLTVYHEQNLELIHLLHLQF